MGKTQSNAAGEKCDDRLLTAGEVSAMLGAPKRWFDDVLASFRLLDSLLSTRFPDSIMVFKF